MKEFDDIETLDFMFDAILWIRGWVKEHPVGLTHALAMVMFNVLLAIIIAL